MADDEQRGIEHRQNPRYRNSRVWTDEERKAHREQRDDTLEDAGLVTDRMIPEDEEDGGADKD